jgi:hypothetical protein
MTVDIFGDIIDADTIEQAALTTLQAWLPDHLAHQERRRPAVAALVPGGHFIAPRSWPTVSDFNLKAEDQLPAVVLVSPGTVGAPRRERGGQYSATWRLEVAIGVAGRDEAEARQIASIYLAAIRGALVQGDPTLGGLSEKCVWTGPDDHAFGPTVGHSRRALYGTEFAVTVHNVVCDRLGPTAPSPDPHNPDDPPPVPDEAEILIEILEDTP